MRRWIWIIVSVLGGIVLLLAIGGPASEPAYQGKSLGVWLRGFESDVAEARWQSAEAMRQMGTNALPHLIARLEKKPLTQEPWWKQGIRAMLSKQSFIKLNLPRSADERRETLAALDALGPAARGAIPAVENLLHENPPDPQALLVLGRLGPEAVPALNRALTNDEKAVRLGARACLDMLESHSEILFPTTPQNAEFMRRTCEFNLQVLNAAFRDYRMHHPEDFLPDGMPQPSLPPDFTPAEFRKQIASRHCRKSPLSMNRPNMRAMVLVPSLVVLTGVVVMMSTREPHYRGRSLTSWLQQCSDTPLSESQRLQESQNAIRAMPLDEVIPRLVRLVESAEDPVSPWIKNKSDKLKLDFLKWRLADDCQQLGVAGFETLGTNAAPAVGALAKLLADPKHAFVAVRCLAAIGKPAESALCQSLTNQDWRVRNWAVPALAEVTDDVEVYIARLKSQFTDPDAAVRFSIVQAIGAQENAPELAVPILIEMLQDRDDGVVSHAASALSSFGTNAMTAFPALTNLVHTGRQAQTRAAMKAIAAIAPVEAERVLRSVILNGSSTDLGAALRNLKSIAPDLALQMAVAELRSTEPRRRSQAVGVLGTYDMDTAGIGDALKSAAIDPDPEVSRHASMAMKQMLRKQNETGRRDLQFPDEPSYDGKTLGEWLKMRHDGWELTTNAAAALQQMGTNAISPLLARLAYKEPVFGLCDFEVSMEAVAGLIGMREQAKPALPLLMILMDSDDQDLAVRAMMATVGTGADAIPCLVKGLTNRFPEVRNEAAGLLAGEWGARFPEQRKQVIPFLVKLLNDPDQNVRMNATNELKELGSQAAINTGIR